MGLKRIFFGVFSLTYLDNHDMKPDQGQNYDTNHIVSENEKDL